MIVSRTERRFKRPVVRRKASKQPKVELYTPERVAEFLLGNAVDATDYARAVKLVRQMGLDPSKIDHEKPTGVA